jgi:hypothetical protein
MGHEVFVNGIACINERVEHYGLTSVIHREGDSIIRGPVQILEYSIQFSEIGFRGVLDSSSKEVNKKKDARPCTLSNLQELGHH